MAATDAEIASLASSHDIIQLGMVADELRRAKHGARTTFVRVADVDAVPGSEAVWPPAAREIRIAGTPADRAAATTRVTELAPRTNGVPLSGFSLADLEALAAADGSSLRSLLEELRAAGLELIAEAPFDRLADPRRALEEANIAGLTVARLTIDRLPATDPATLFREVAGLQRDVAVIRVFAPLARRTNPAVPSTGYDDVKRVALARIIADNIATIQVDWARYGPKLAQVALTVGADDVDAVSASDETPQGRRRAALEEVRRNITAAGLEPVERNGRFDPVS
jgi:aminodeoxyfutalosine synthase